MSSSFALWCDRYSRNHFEPRAADVEVHINLWRHVSKWRRHKNFIEIGMLFRDSYEVGKVCFFIPTSQDEIDIVDLSQRLKSDTALSAVFNDVIRVGERITERWHDTEKNGRHYATIYRFRAGDDYTVETVGENENFGTIVTFTPELCGFLRSAGPHYVRFRLLLSNSAASQFSFDAEAEDATLPTSVEASEITEIRFNELRNLPLKVSQMIEGGSAKSFRISAAHCFVVRDLKFEFAAAHASFNKMRRLEANLWEEYLAPDVNAGAARRMIVYHWRVVAPAGGDVGSFIALAKFRRSRLNVLISSIGIIILGALGSASEAMLANIFGVAPDSDHQQAALLLGAAFIALLALTFTPPLLRSAMANLLRRLRRCMKG